MSRSHARPRASAAGALLCLALLACGVAPKAAGGRMLLAASNSNSSTQDSGALFLPGRGPAQLYPVPLHGCTHTVQNSNETLLQVSGSLDVEMDVLQAHNAGSDLTSPGAISQGRVLNIPCPGTTFLHFLPVYTAGCFFTHIIGPSETTLLTLARNPPSDVPGPYSIKGIWTANYQSSGGAVDLLAPGQWYVGREIFLPTCGHSSILATGQLKFDKATGCAYDPSKQGVAPGPLPLTLSQLATLLGTDVGTLQRLNPGKGLQAQTEVLRSSGSGKGVASSLGPISIPCPGVA